MPGAMPISRLKRGAPNLLSLIVAVSLAAAILLLLSAMQGVKAWSLDPAVNTPICTAASDQIYPDLISDGSGGAIIVWMDHRSGNYDIFVQRVSASGTPLWTGDGVAVCTTASYQGDPALIYDGSGGAIIVWTDYRSGAYDIYAQRVNELGAPLWTGDGIAICTAASEQAGPYLTTDGSGGAIVVWEDSRSGNCDIYAQRVNAFGGPQWTGDGMAICTAVHHQENPGLIADGSGGAFIAWTDSRSGNGDVYAQRVNSLGASQWTDGGLAICNATGHQIVTGMDSDGSGGVFMTWEDGRGGANYDVYAQRLNSSGVPQWMSNGLAICNSTADQVLPNAVADGSGSVIIAWTDRRSGSNYDIYAQRVDSSGMPEWMANGLAVCYAAGDQVGPPMIGDGYGGAVITWMDDRSGNCDIYAQRVNGFGGLGAPPHQPSNGSPTDGAFGVSLTPVLQSSAFSDPDSGDTHSGSQWRIRTVGGDYSNPIFDSNTDSVNLLQISVPSGKLIGNTTYYWQVRHRDGRQEWSAWSAETSLTTQNVIPNQPANVSPASGASGTKLKAVLESSAFSDPDAADTHAASQWHIASAAGDYSSPVFDSGTDDANLLQMTVPSGKLKGTTTYYWQVRHQDSHGGWSEWSEESSFTTQKTPQNWIWIWIVVGLAAVALLAVGIGIWRLRSAKKGTATVSDGGGSHGV